jgi:hypothetical protein
MVLFSKDYKSDLSAWENNTAIQNDSKEPRSTQLCKIINDLGLGHNISQFSKSDKVDKIKKSILR